MKKYFILIILVARMCLLLFIRDINYTFTESLYLCQWIDYFTLIQKCMYLSFWNQINNQPLSDNHIWVHNTGSIYIVFVYFSLREDDDSLLLFYKDNFSFYFKDFICWYLFIWFISTFPWISAEMLRSGLHKLR